MQTFSEFSFHLGLVIGELSHEEVIEDFLDRGADKQKIVEWGKVLIDIASYIYKDPIKRELK